MAFLFDNTLNDKLKDLTSQLKGFQKYKNTSLENLDSSYQKEILLEKKKKGNEIKSYKSEIKR